MSTIDSTCHGSLTIHNSTTWLLQRFYFNLDLFNRIQSGSYNYREHFLKDVQLLFALIGITDAFFSWLEHICVLLLAVSDYDPDSDDILKFVRQDWTTKYNRVFQPHRDRRFERKYKELRRIKESIRNTYTHGGIRTSNSEILRSLERGGCHSVQFVYGAFASKHQDSRLLL